MQSLTTSSFGRFFQALLVYLPVLILGLLGYLAMLGIFMNVEPLMLQNVWATNSYAPLMLLSFVSDWLVFSYVLFHPRRGAIASVVVNVLFFLKLQQMFEEDLVWKVVAAGVGVELCVQLMLFTWRRLQMMRMRRLSNRPAALTELPIGHGETAPTPHSNATTHPRRRGRERKHHFFGQ